VTKAFEEAIHEGVIRLTRSRVDDHTRSFLNHRELFIGIDHIKGHLLRSELNLRRRWGVTVNSLSLT
jgi:hypothetical protein